jgi:Tol biopolymer transport system component
LSLTAGSRFGPYEILAPLGAGGMGEVFRARDTKLEREVALKLLPPQFASDPERLQRFEREAKLLASLNHPNIAHVYGFEQELLPDGSSAHFLAMELVPGQDLAERLRHGALPVDEAIATATRIAEALEAAHEKGIVHRDLKPANVKLTPDGEVKVLDFGLAKAYAGDATGGSSGGLSQSPTLAHTGTEAGVILGTAAYMSPEQARGKAVDKRSDIWAFGALVFELLTGRKLFDGETVTDVLAAVVRQEIDWSALPVATPPRVRRLLRRCLERDPKQRLRDIGEARIALAAGEEPAPAPAGLSRRAAAGLIGGAAGGAFALGYGLGRRLAATGGGAADASSAGLSVSRITSSGNVTEAAISPDGRFVAYVESEQGEQSLWLRQVASGQTLRLIPTRRFAYWGHVFTRDGNSIVFGRRSPEDTDGAFYSISTLGGTPRRLVTGIDSAPTFSPDGSRMAWVRAHHPTPEESALMVARADGTEARVLAAVTLPEKLAPIFFTAPDWSPDGRRIACAVVRLRGGGVEENGKLIAVSVEDGAIETLADPGWIFAAQVAWLPDNSGLLAVARTEGESISQIWLVPLPRGAARRVTSDLLDYRILSLTADGRSLLTVASDILASIWIQPLDGKGRPQRLTSSKVDGLRGLDFTPDGRIVYSSRQGSKLGIWVTTADASEQSPLATGDGDVVAPVVTRSGQVYCVAQTRSATEIRRVSLDGAPPVVVASGVFDQDFAVSPDERFLVYSALHDGESRLFRVSTAGGPPQPVVDSLAYTPSFSPDGKRLAFYYVDRASNRFRIGIAPAEGGAIVQSLEAEPPATGSKIRFQADGLYLNTMPRDRANVWLQPLDGRPARRVTDFQDFILYGFAVSPDGKSLAYSRGPRTRDAVLIRDFR